jgi:type IV secretion system protein VirB2
VHHPTHPSTDGQRRGLVRRTLDRQAAVRVLGLVAFALVVLLLPSEAVAGTGGVDLPWNTPLQNLLDNMTGSTARILAGLMLVVGGIVWGFTRNEEGAKRFGQAIVAIALMFGAVQIVNALAFAGGVV